MVAAAIVGSAVVGAVAADRAGDRAADAANAQAGAASESVQLGRERLAWEKEQYEDNKEYRERANETALDIADAMLESNRQNTALAEEYANYQRTTFRPLEQGIVADAQNYDTAERRRDASNAAIADVNKGFASTREATMRRLAAEGIDPGDARAMAALGDGAVDQATAQAGAAFKARQGVETVGRAMRMDAANLGRNLASNQATSAQVAIQAGNSATNNATVPVQVNQNAAAAVGAGYDAASLAAARGGSLYGDISRTYAGQSDAMWGALGQLGGAAISRYSDQNLKTDIEPLNEDEALEEVNATPVSNWKYDPAKMAQRGIPMSEEDEGEQTGPMAQDVAQTMGEGASDGTKLNLGTMLGKTMAAVQAVDKKVNRLARLIGDGQLQASAA